jgi:hypothetical protein
VHLRRRELVRIPAIDFDDDGIARFDVDRGSGVGSRESEIRGIG